ncbi:hypothetical protein LXL04_016954 [Taraxacum kok-saghyz]
MVLKLPANEGPDVAFQSIGCGYDISLDLRLKNVKKSYFGNNPHRMSRLIEIDDDEGRDIMLPGGVLIMNVPESIKCDKGEHTRFQSGDLSFQQMSEQFNWELSLDGKIPSGLFNSMFEFSGNWQKDASITKSLALDGVFISLYNIALEKSWILLCDYVKNDVPSSWDPPLLARFIEKYGTHIIVGVKNVIYMKQHISSLEHNNINEMADNRFLESDVQFVINSGHISQNDEDFISISRRGGSNDENLTHNEWLRSIQLKPHVINMSFIPITSLLNDKPPIEELREFLDSHRYSVPSLLAFDVSDDEERRDL